jgi:hypothetical protein
MFVMVFSSIGLCYPPDNAAVLYYKACLVIGDPPEDIAGVIIDIIKGTSTADEKVKDYSKAQSKGIRIALDASTIPECDWGMDYSKGFELLLPHLGPMRRVCKTILLDAQIKAETGNIEEAIEQSLACFKIARHIKKDTTIISSLVGISAEQLACESIESILSKQDISEELLKEIRNTLKEMTKDYRTMKECISMETDFAANYIRMENMPALFEELGIKDDVKIAEFNAKFDEEMLAKSIEYYREHMATLVKAFELPYSDAIASMRTTDEQMKEDLKKKNEVLLSSVISPAAGKCLNNEVAALNRINALRCAVEIYLQIQKSEKLPDKLPQGTPKDNFSGKDFIYEKTKEGFVLKCQGKDLIKDKIHEYEFKVAN